MEEKRLDEARAIAFSCVACGVRLGRERDWGKRGPDTREAETDTLDFTDLAFNK